VEVRSSNGLGLVNVDKIKTRTKSMALHNKIMNIRAKPPKTWEVPAWRVAFKQGHKQARHDAAELALRADALADELREIYEWARLEQAPLREQEMASIQRVLAEYGA
jgi:hypothetical protein